MTEFSAQFEDEEIQRKFQELQNLTEDLTPVMQEIGEYMIMATDLRFEQEVDPSGKRWKKLSPYTLELKRAEGKILKILQRTGLMRSRVNYQADSEKVVIGVNDAKAAKHQLGRGVAKREFLGVSEDDREEIINIIEDNIQAIIDD